MKNLKSLLSFALVIVVPTSFVCARAADFTVVLGPSSLTFSPATLSISQGDTVTWTNAAAATPHTSTSGSSPGTPDGLWNSSTLSQSGTRTFTMTFNNFAAKTYPYYCSFHFGFGMVGFLTITNSAVMPPPRQTNPPPPTNPPPTVNFTGPSGEFTNRVTAASNSVWDITAVFDITNVNCEVEKDGNRRVIVDYPVTLDQGGNGNIFASGSTTVDLSFDDNGTFTNAPPFIGSYKVIGAIASSRGRARGSLSEGVSGATLISDKTRNLKSTHRVDFNFDNLARTSTAVIKDTASAAGLGTVSSRATNGPVALSSVIMGDGSWTLTMSLSTTSRKVNGSAVVTLNSGRTFPLTVKGSFKPATQLSKLTLAGAGVGKGSLLQVTMNADTVASIRGRISGQAVNASL